MSKPKASEINKVNVRFFTTEGGAQPVKHWLRGLEQANRSAIGQDLQRVQYRWPVGMPLCKSLGGGLWEVRTNLSDGRIARVFFSFQVNCLVALHGIVKKMQKTPQVDLDLARKRMRKIENDSEQTYRIKPR